MIGSVEQRQSVKQALRRFADMRFGLMIHWGPAVLRNEEISWSMSNRDEYEQCFAQFNPQRFDADEWASIATMAGMKYAICVTKHHDGFCLWDTRTTDANVMNTPMKRDVTGEFAAACRRRELCFGTYLSIMDIHEDKWNGCYPSGADMPGYPEGIPHILDFTTHQCLELMEKYQPDIVWYDGHWLQGWDTLTAKALDAKLKEVNPTILTCRLMVDPVIKGEAWDHEHNAGDFHSMEAKIGTYMATPWEVVTSVAYPCYSHNTELKFKTATECIQMLSRIVCGNGNLLLNFIPDKDGAICDVQKQIAKGIGTWLVSNGQAVYGTRGGPWCPGAWGGSTRCGNRIFLHLFPHVPETLRLPACDVNILAARALNGMPVTYTQNEAGVDLHLAKEGRDPMVTVVELTMDEEVTGMIKDHELRSIFEGNSVYGGIISANATLTLSSTSIYDLPEQHPSFFSGDYAGNGYAFHTGQEENPFAIVDLGAVRRITGVAVENREQCADRAATLRVSLSQDGTTWKEVWKADIAMPRWEIPLTDFHDAGGKDPGMPARYIKLETRPANPEALHLRRIEVYGF